MGLTQTAEPPRSVTPRTAVLSEQAFRALAEHWAVAAIGTDDLSRAVALVDARQTKRARFACTPTSDDMFLERISLVYELVVIESLDGLGRGVQEWPAAPCAAAAFCLFTLRRTLPLPDGHDARLFEALRLSAAAIIGQRQGALAAWYHETGRQLNAERNWNAAWDRRCLDTVTGSWITLFRRAAGLHALPIKAQIAQLRREQESGAAQCCRKGSAQADPAGADRRVALTRWAQATEILALARQDANGAETRAQLDTHFDSAIRAATAGGHGQLVVLFKWLRAAGQLMASEIAGLGPGTRANQDKDSKATA